MKTNLTAKWFYGVDSLRFILAFLVLLSHSDLVYATVLKHSTYSLLRYFGYFLANVFDGTSAVIGFFIISGFVIHYPNKNGIPNLVEFWIRRFLRIFIPLIVILTIGAWFNHPEKTVVWSLYCELIYYGIYPFLWMVKLNWKNKFIIAYLIAAAVICLFARNDIIGFFRQTNTTSNSNYWQLGVFLTSVVGLPCWLLGVLIAENIDQLKQATFNSIIIYRVLVFTISSFCCFARFHLHITYILSMNIFALLLYKWIQTEIVYFKSNKPNQSLEKMGKFSYSLYLCHPLIYLTLGYFIKNNIYTYPFLILLTIVISYGFYLIIEKPSHIIARKINNILSYSVS